MTAAPAVLVVLLVPALLGFGILRAIGPRMGRLDAAGWIYPLGAFATAALAGLWVASGVPPNRWVAVAVPAAAGVVLLAAFRGRRRDPVRPEPVPARHARIERAAFWAALAAVVVVLVDRIAVYDLVPVLRGDEAWMWAMRAKVLWVEWTAGRASPARSPDMLVLAQADYPLLNPLLNLWVYAVSGGVVHVLNRVPFQAVLLSAVIFTAARVRSLLRPGLAALFLLLWIPGRDAGLFVLGGYADVLVACGFLLALEAWRAFAADGSRGAWRLFAFALAFLAWSKHDGVVLALVAVLGCVVHAIRDRAVARRIGALGPHLSWLALPAALVATTWIVNAASGFENYLISANPGRRPVWERAITQFPERAWPAARYLLEHVFLSPDASRLLWIPFAVCTIVLPGLALSTRHVHATVSVLCGALGYWLVFIGSSLDLQWQLGCAAERVYFHFLPALLVWTAHMASDAVPRFGRTGASRG